MECVFAALRAQLCETPILTFPREGGEFIVDTDASNKGISAILSSTTPTLIPKLGAWYLQRPVPCTAEECWYYTYLKKQVEMRRASLLPPWLPLAPDLTE
ncbi:hypothetical protein AOLI_G00151030 [Acnodon oligacanthus]